MTWKKWDMIPTTILCSKCWATGLSEITSRKKLCLLYTSKTQIRIFNEIQSQGYSVRKVEDIVKALSSGETMDSGGKKIKPKGSKLSEGYTLLQSHLCGFFGSKVQLSCTAKGKGDVYKRQGIDGLRNAEWVAMDYSDVLVHVFLPETRNFYNLEHLWADAKLTQIPDLD